MRENLTFKLNFMQITSHIQKITFQLFTLLFHIHFVSILISSLLKNGEKTNEFISGSNVADILYILMITEMSPTFLTYQSESNRRALCAYIFSASSSSIIVSVFDHTKFAFALLCMVLVVSDV